MTILHEVRADLKKIIKNILSKWNEVINEAKQCQVKGAQFNKNLKYGLYQIEEDLCSAVVEKEDKFGKKYYEKAYKELNNLVFEFKKELEKYYKENIHNKLFEYQLLK